MPYRTPQWKLLPCLIKIKLTYLMNDALGHVQYISACRPTGRVTKKHYEHKNLLSLVMQNFTLPEHLPLFQLDAKSYSCVHSRLLGLLFHRIRCLGEYPVCQCCTSKALFMSYYLNRSCAVAVFLRCSRHFTFECQIRSSRMFWQTTPSTAVGKLGISERSWYSKQVLYNKYFPILSSWGRK